MISSCTCAHTDQDRRYGKGKRVHNPCKDGDWRCTVCSQKGSKHNTSGGYTPKDSK